MTDLSDHDELSESLARIAGLLLNEETLQSVLELVVALSQRTIPVADGVGVTLRAGGSHWTAAYSSPMVRELDDIQYATDEGPCISAIRERKIYRIEDLVSDGRWPRFGEAATAEGLMSVLSVPFIPAQEPIGSLNMYSKIRSAFDDVGEETARLFAQQASIVLANSQAYTNAEQLNEQLRDALHSRETIGEAKGILMSRQGVSAEEAFDILRERSQHSNRKLRDIAREIVAEVEERIGGKE